MSNKIVGNSQPFVANYFCKPRYFAGLFRYVAERLISCRAEHVDGQNIAVVEPEHYRRVNKSNKNVFAGECDCLSRRSSLQYFWSNGFRHSSFALLTHLNCRQRCSILSIICQKNSTKIRKQSETSIRSRTPSQPTARIYWSPKTLNGSYARPKSASNPSLVRRFPAAYFLSRFLTTYSRPLAKSVYISRPAYTIPPGEPIICALSKTSP